MTSSILTFLPSAAERTIADSEIDAIIARCLAGDDAAYALLYRHCAPMIYRLNMSLLSHNEDAEEVLQDSFEYAFRKLHQFDASKSAFKTWLYRIAISRCRNKRRRKWLPTFSMQQMVGEGETIADASAPQPDDLLRMSDEQKRVWHAITQLSDKLREVAVLRYYDDMRYQEIGQALGISHKTAESRMRLAHKKLRILLS